MKNVAPKPCFFSNGPTMVAWLATESSKVRTTSLSGTFTAAPGVAGASAALPTVGSSAAAQTNERSHFKTEKGVCMEDVESGRGDLSMTGLAR